MGLSEGVATSREGHSFSVVHCHTSKSLADVLSAEQWVRVRVWSFWIDVNQSHLNSGKRIVEVLASVTVAIVAEPLVFSTPVNVFFWVPNVRSATAETKHWSAHGFNGDNTCQNQKIGPTDFVSVLLLDWPKQTSCFVEVSVVWPTVQRSESLSTCASSTATVTDPIGSCSVPGHSNEKGPIVAVVCRPPILTVGHQCVKIFFHGSIIHTVECVFVNEVLAHRV